MYLEAMGRRRVFLDAGPGAVTQCRSSYSIVDALSRTCETDRDGLLLDLGHVGVAKHVRDGSLRVPGQIQVSKLAGGDL